MTKTVDEREVVLLLESIVGEFGPDYTYTDHFDACKNFWPGQPDPKSEKKHDYFADADVAKDGTWTPACIVGHVFHRLGITKKECGNASVIFSVDNLRTNGSNIHFTRGAILLLTAAQTVQDHGGTWGLSLTVASELYQVMKSQ